MTSHLKSAEKRFSGSVFIGLQYCLPTLKCLHGLLRAKHTFLNVNAMSKSHLAKSKLLEEILVALRKKGKQIPENIMSDLKSARTLMQVENVDLKDRGETEPKIDQYLANVEAYLISEAETNFEPEKVEKWLTAMDLASCETCITVEPQKQEMRMIPGVPRDQKWIRVTPIASLPVEKLEKMATEDGLGSRREKDGHLIVYGSDQAVKGFIKKISKPNGERNAS